MTVKKHLVQIKVSFLSCVLCRYIQESFKLPDVACSVLDYFSSAFL